MTDPIRTKIRLDQPLTRRRRLPRYDADAFGRLSEQFAQFLGTGKFILWQTVVVIIWIALNLAGVSFGWDPYPFILLNLAFSTQAAYAAPLILLAQNRQADRDRISLEEDRQRALAGKADTEYLARELAALRLAIGEVATREYLRSEVSRLVEELRETDGEKKDRERETRRLNDIRRETRGTRRARTTPKKG
jgi:uncharacterized membrane protein